jgi:hypothetical protein
MTASQVMMKNCWNKDPANRPTFIELDRTVKAMDVTGMQSRAIRNGVRLPFAVCRFHFAFCRFRFAFCLLPFAVFILHFAVYRFHFTVCRLPFAVCHLL